MVMQAPLACNGHHRTSAGGARAAVRRTKMHHSAPARTKDTPMNTALRLAMLCVALLLAAFDSHADDFQLITADEAKQEAKAVAEAPPEPRTRSLPIPKPGQPAIRVVTPNVAGASVEAPVRIEVTFKPAPGTRIVPSTFRVLYGLMKIDLTDRLKKHATVTETGVVVDQARVPAGQHRLILQVADDQGNTAEQELRLRVGAAS
jgi:hypothetical protein